MIVKMQHVAPFLLLMRGQDSPHAGDYQVVGRQSRGAGIRDRQRGNPLVARPRRASSPQSELSTGRASAQRELPAVPRDTPVPFQSYEFIGASEKVSLRALAGCQLVEDSAVSPS